MSDRRRADVDQLIQHMTDIFSSERVFAIHAAGQRPLITSNQITAFENVRNYSPFHDMVYADIQRIERKSPGAGAMVGLFLPCMLLSSLSALDCGTPWITLVDQTEERVRENIAQVATINQYPTWTNIVAAAIHYLSPAELETFNAATRIAGPAGKIYLEKTKGPDHIVERIIGNSFRVMPNRAVLESGHWTRDFVKCAVIDGIVENVSEIDRLLTACHETRVPTVIFARGFADDVISTLAVNKARKTLDVIPVTVSYDLDSINTLVDIAIVCGTDVCSSLQGDLISAIKFDELPTVQSISCIANSVTIRNDVTRSAVERHTTQLFNRMGASDIVDIGKLLNDRIMSLTSDYVRVTIGAPTEQASQTSLENLEFAFRTMAACKAGGTVDISAAFMLPVVNLPRPVPSVSFCLALQSSALLQGQILSVLSSAS